MNRLSFILIATSVTALFAGSPGTAWSQEWVRCAAEGEQCDLDGVGVVRYGAQDRWAYAVGTDVFQCDNQQVGDPAPAVPKACWRWAMPDEVARAGALASLQSELEGQGRYIADLEAELAAARDEIRQLRRGLRRERREDFQPLQRQRQ